MVHALSTGGESGELHASAHQVYRGTGGNSYFGVTDTQLPDEVLGFCRGRKYGIFAIPEKGVGKNGVDLCKLGVFCAEIFLFREK